MLAGDVNAACSGGGGGYLGWGQEVTLPLWLLVVEGVLLLLVVKVVLVVL